MFFAIGLAPALLVFFIHRLVPESGVYAEAKAARAGGAETAPFWDIFARAYVMITWLPTYLRTVLNLSVTTSAGYLALNILGSLVGPFCYGWLSDRVGRRPAFMAFLVLQACNVAVYLLAPIGAGTTVALSFFLGAFQGGLASGMLPTFAELFPTSIRASGQGFCLGGGRGFGSVVPATVGLLAAATPLGTAMGTCALCVCLRRRVLRRHRPAGDERRRPARGVARGCCGIGRNGAGAGEPVAGTDLARLRPHRGMVRPPSTSAR